ncbi:unnamed protein product [Haemonchus placei]|uniref:DUF19 domain-containing protein n=1 Tax=Haemonchus placei TaxID=6290 RepID=A0A158QNE4_HAEPC|nr:unnamed protein product [Haemonchus placei]
MFPPKWTIFLGVLQVTQSFSLIDRICKTNRSFDRCASRIRKEENHNETQSTWIRADQLSDEDQKFLRLARQSGDDPSCKKLKTEYDQVCFTPPPPQAFEETKEFCSAFVETCPETLKTNLFTHITELHIDYSAYCKKSRERFRYVCPKPFRFKTYAEQAVDFCIRYKDRCPDEKLPDEPVPFKKEDETHIYIREIQSACKNMYRGARTYCFHPELLKYPKYAIPCYFYKMQCIDVYTKVIYG